MLEQPPEKLMSVNINTTPDTTPPSAPLKVYEKKFFNITVFALLPLSIYRHDLRRTKNGAILVIVYVFPVKVTDFGEVTQL